MNTVIQRGDTPAAVRMIRRGLLAGLVAGCDSAPVSEPDVCLAQGIICTSVGTGRLGFNGDGLPAADTNLYWPQAVRFDREGRLVVADLNNFRVRRVETDGTVMTILGNGFHLASSEGLRATESPVDFPADVRFLPDGSYYVVAIHENRVLWVDTEAVVHVVIGDGNEGYTGDGAPARDAQLSGPSGMALADDGTLYVADTLNHAIRVVTPDGMINTLAGRGLPGFAGDGGPASGALLNNPTALTLDGDTLLVVGNGQWSRFADDGAIKADQPFVPTRIVRLKLPPVRS